MAAQAEVRSGRGGCLLALLAVAAVVALIAVPALNRHALERHGWHAVSAARQLRKHTPEPGDQDGEDRYWNGTDAQGREIHVLRLPQVAGKPVTWAILILGGGGTFVVTAFLVQSRRSVERIKGKCR